MANAHSETYNYRLRKRVYEYDIQLNSVIYVIVFPWQTHTVRHTTTDFGKGYMNMIYS
jgi:preprotein translocase subunit SecA